MGLFICSVLYSSEILRQIKAIKHGFGCFMDVSVKNGRGVEKEVYMVRVLIGPFPGMGQSPI